MATLFTQDQLYLLNSTLQRSIQMAHSFIPLFLSTENVPDITLEGLEKAKLSCTVGV